MTVGDEGGEGQQTGKPEVEAQAEPEAVSQELPEDATEGEATPEPEPEPEPEQQEADKNRWHNRRSIRALRLEMEDASGLQQFDQRDNDEARLPPEEEVRLGGLVLVEAFTPSTASSLKKALREFPGRNGRNDEWLARVEEGRSAAGRSGYQNLGMVRRPGEFGMDGFDPELPDTVDAVWTSIFWFTPSLTVVVATFTLKDNGNDISNLLRADYQTSVSKVRIQVPGRFGRIRCKIPWSRPKSSSGWQSMARSEENRVIACESMIAEHEQACWDWFTKKFPGVFSVTDNKTMPMARILITKEKKPFQDYQRQFAAVGLSSVLDVWDSTDLPGWKLSSRGPHRRRNILTFAARGKDVAGLPGGDMPGDSIWYLTQMFGRHQSSLVARWGITRLLSLYTNRLASLRDHAGRSLRIRWPVREARDLDQFLIRDGLDASTIIAELEAATSDLNQFRRDVVEYAEDVSRYPQNVQNTRTPDEFVPILCDSIQYQAERLKRDMEAVTSNIAASAQLRQAIANTRLQRSVIFLTIVTIAIALASLYVSVHSSGGKAPSTAAALG